jgi:hypothetical protein
MPTNLIATEIEALDGTLLALGQLCLTPVSTATLRPTAFSVGGGGQVLARQVCFPVTNGSIGPDVMVADTLLATPSIGYLVRVLDQQGIEISALVGQYIQPTGAIWSLDDWTPTQSIPVLPVAISSGTAPPSGTCTAPSLYYQGSTLYCCVAGAWEEVAGGGAIATHDEPLTDGLGNFIFAGGDIVTVMGVPN